MLRHVSYRDECACTYWKQYCQECFARKLTTPRRTCTARVIVVGFVCVCLSVKSHFTSGSERLFILKSISHTQREKKVKKLWGFLWNCFVSEIQYFLCRTCTRTGGHFFHVRVYTYTWACTYRLIRVWLEGLLFTFHDDGNPSCKLIHQISDGIIIYIHDSEGI